MASHLHTARKITDPDDFYEKLLELHDGLDDAASARLNARLILLLANHIGDRRVLEEAFEAARTSDII